MTSPDGTHAAPEVFISYAHADQVELNELLKHLSPMQSQGFIRIWHDQMVLPGDQKREAVEAHLASAEFILLLVTKNYLASKRCYDVELPHAMARHDRGEANVLPVFVGPCDVEHAPFMRLEALPFDRTFIATWKHKDQAWVQVCEALRDLVVRSSASRSRRRLRWWSTLDSVWNGEISVLAVLETLGAMALSIWAVYQYQTLTHVVVAVSVVPPLMLRTEASMTLAVKWWLSAVGWLCRWVDVKPEDLDDPEAMVKVAPFWVIVALVTVVTRATATLVTFYRDPLGSLRAVPHNWSSAILSVDTVQPVEILPGATYILKGGAHLEWLPVSTDKHESEKQYKTEMRRREGYDKALQLLRHLRFKKLLPVAMVTALLIIPAFYAVTHTQLTIKGYTFHLSSYQRSRALAVLMVLSSLTAMFGLPFFYRWSMKATAVVWSPLLWFADSTGDDRAPFAVRLKLTIADATARVAVWYSALVVLLFAGKLLLYYRVDGVAEWWHRQSFSEALAFFVDPSGMPIWQLALAGNAVGGLMLYFWASRLNLMLEHNVALRLDRIRKAFQAIRFVRASLGYITALSCVYVLARRALSLPAMPSISSFLKG